MIFAFLFSFFLTLILACFAQTNVDNTIRNFYMPLAAAAYSDPRPCLLSVQKRWATDQFPNENYTLYRQYVVPCNSLNGTCSGYIAVDNPNDPTFNIPTFIIGFRGPLEDFYEQTWNPNEMVPFVGGGKISKQFLDAFNKIWIYAQMKDDVLTLKNKYPSSIFYIVGHSTGGAMASIVAATVVSTNILSHYLVFLFTFGQPRIGDKDFAITFNSLGIGSKRVIHNADMVPHLPSLNETFYYHHLQELWYSNDMVDGDTYIECSTVNGEDPKCSNSLADSTLTFNDHRYYYGRKFDEFGINGCPGLGTSMRKNLRNA